jgi:N-acetyl-1-D-myo-inositol-2-amino-2-deoxy-alpha-D-glucopyranoside deacetylase
VSVFDGVRRVVFAHAHPDDETLATGALLAELVGRGIECPVVTATRGERGEVVEGRFPGLVGEEFIARREVELAGALAVLGVPGPVFLGEPPARVAGSAPRRYADSGMRWVRPGLAGPADDAGPDSFTAAGIDEPAADLAAALGTLGADLVVTYDDAGSYGHPDHIHLHHVTRAAAYLAGVPMAELVSDPETPGEWLDLRDRLPTVTRALEHHRTQVTVDGDHVIHSGGQREPILVRIGVRPVTES